jgi:hypothetical protein
MQIHIFVKSTIYQQTRRRSQRLRIHDTNFQCQRNFTSASCLIQPPFYIANFFLLFLKGSYHRHMFPTRFKTSQFLPKKYRPTFITITILDIIHRPVFYLKHNVSETPFCLRLQVENNQVHPTDRVSLCLRTLATTALELFLGPTESNPDLWICSQELWPLGQRGGLLSPT